MRNVSVPVQTYIEYTITNAEFNLINDLYSSERKVSAIKFIRVQYNLGLKEAKDLCDNVFKDYTPPFYR